MSNLVLYRKYRPKTFADVVSQEHIKTTLANAVVNSRVGHAYLFIGPRGVGKTTLARIFARAINCPNRKGSEPCNECDICKSFLEGSSLDLLEIDAASHTGVDNIRELIDHLQFAPAQAQYKVIIIDEVHMLSKGAFNALLKTLEEPPKHAVFILATTEAHKVPATIISRTQRFDFKKVSLADLSKLLKFVAEDNKVQVSGAALLEIASAADGSFRDSLSLLDQVINFADGEVTEQLVEEVLGLTGTRTLTEFMDLILQKDAKGAVEFVGNLIYAGRDAYQFEKDFLEYLRKVLLVKVGAKSELGLGDETVIKIQDQAGQLETNQIIKIIEIFQKAESEMKWAVIQSLPLELAAVEASQMGNNPVAVMDKPSSVPSTAVKTVSETQVVLLSPTQSDNPGELNQIIASWPQIMDKIKDYNHSLVSSLKMSRPVAVTGKELVVLFPYKFHKDAIEARKNRIIVDQVIEEVSGLKLIVRPVTEKDWQGNVVAAPVPPAEKGLLKSALNILGGEIE